MRWVKRPTFLLPHSKTNLRMNSNSTEEFAPSPHVYMGDSKAVTTLCVRLLKNTKESNGFVSDRCVCVLLINSKSHDETRCTKAAGSRLPSHEFN